MSVLEITMMTISVATMKKIMPIGVGAIEAEGKINI